MEFRSPLHPKGKDLKMNVSLTWRLGDRYWNIWDTLIGHVEVSHILKMSVSKWSLVSQGKRVLALTCV